MQMNCIHQMIRNWFVTALFIFSLKLKIQLSLFQAIQELRWRTRFQRDFLVPILIIISFAVFYFVPYMVRVWMDVKRTCIHYSIAIVGCVGLTLDPFLYVFLTKRYRKSFSKKQRNNMRFIREMTLRIALGMTCGRDNRVHDSS